MRIGAVVASALSVFVAGAAETEPVRLTFRGPSDCLDAEAFVKEVRARTTRFRIVASGDDARSFNVRVLAFGHHYLGDVNVIGRKGDVSLLSVSGTDCDDVARTLAFVTAISIDPKASSTPPPPPQTPDPAPEPTADQPQAPPPTVAPPPPPSAAPVPVSAPSPAAITFGLVADESPAAAESHAPVEQPPRSWHATVGLGASVQSLAAPAAVVGDSLFLAFASDTGRLFSPEVRIGASRASSGTLAAVQGSATLQWTTGRVDLCPLRLPARGALDVRPCLGGDAGALSATAVSIPHAQSHVRPWGTVGALARLEWLPFDPLVLDAEVSLSTPFAREHFYVAPTDVVYQAPLLVAAGEVALGVRFP